MLHAPPNLSSSSCHDEVVHAASAAVRWLWCACRLLLSVHSHHLTQPPTAATHHKHAPSTHATTGAQHESPRWWPRGIAHNSSSAPQAGQPWHNPRPAVQVAGLARGNINAVSSFVCVLGGPSSADLRLLVVVVAAVVVRVQFVCFACILFCACLPSLCDLHPPINTPVCCLSAHLFVPLLLCVPPSTHSTSP